MGATVPCQRTDPAKCCPSARTPPHPPRGFCLTGYRARGPRKSAWPLWSVWGGPHRGTRSLRHPSAMTGGCLPATMLCFVGWGGGGGDQLNPGAAWAGRPPATRRSRRRRRWGNPVQRGATMRDEEHRSDAAASNRTPIGRGWTLGVRWRLKPVRTDAGATPARTSSHVVARGCPCSLGAPHRPVRPPQSRGAA